MSDTRTVLERTRASAKRWEAAGDYGIASDLDDVADAIEAMQAALKAVQEWMEGADIIAEHPGPRVLLAGYPKDEVDTALSKGGANE